MNEMLCHSNFIADLQRKHEKPCAWTSASTHLQNLAMRFAGDKWPQEGEEPLDRLAGPDQNDVLDIFPEGPRQATIGGYQQSCLHLAALAASTQAHQ